MEMMIRVPVGYRTDFASIPRFFWRILPPAGRYGKAAVVHDWLCDESPKRCDHIAAANVFGEAMEVLMIIPPVEGETKVQRCKRLAANAGQRTKIIVMVKAVKWFGPRFKAGDV
jgi:hypothetical protein